VPLVPFYGDPESPSLSMALPIWRGFHGHLRVSWENAMQVSAILDKQGATLSWINSGDCIGLEQQLAKSAFQFLAASWVLDLRQRPDRSTQNSSKCAGI
jgi:hypothetical protein